MMRRSRASTRRPPRSRPPPRFSSGPRDRPGDAGARSRHRARARRLRVAELVGPDGAVVGVDLSAPLLEHAERRARPPGWNLCASRGRRADLPLRGAVRRHRHPPAAVPPARRRRRAPPPRQGLRPGGRLVALDYDIGASRRAARGAAGPGARLGRGGVPRRRRRSPDRPRLARILARAGLADAGLARPAALLRPARPDRRAAADARRAHARPADRGRGHRHRGGDRARHPRARLTGTPSRWTRR